MAGEMTREDIDSLIPKERVPVRLVKEQGKGWLALKNSVLILGSSNPVSSEVHFYPIESVHILPPLRRLGKNIIQHVLFILMTVLLTTLFLAYHQSFDTPAVIVGVTGGALILGALGLIVRSFLLGYPTSRLQFDTDGKSIEFWHRPGKNEGIDELLKGVRRLQHETEIPEDYSQKPTSHVLYSRPWVALILQAVVFSFPAIVLENALLLLLLAVPLVQFAYLRFKMLGAPVNIRKALNLRIKKRYGEAEKLINEYLESAVSDVNGWLLLTDVYIADGELEEAEESVNAMRSLGLLETWQIDELRAYIDSWRRVFERLGGHAGEAGLVSGETAESPAE